MAKGDMGSNTDRRNMGMGQGGRGQLSTVAPQTQKPNIGAGPSSNNFMQMLQQVMQNQPQQGPGGGGGKHGGGYGGGLGMNSTMPTPPNIQNTPIGQLPNIVGKPGNPFPTMPGGNDGGLFNWQNMPGVTRSGSNLMKGGQQWGHVGKDNQAVWNNGMGPFQVYTANGGRSSIQKPAMPGLQPSAGIIGGSNKPGTLLPGVGTFRPQRPDDWQEVNRLNGLRGNIGRWQSDGSYAS